MFNAYCNKGIVQNNVRTCLSKWSNSLIFDYLFDLFLLIDFILRYNYFAFNLFEGERENVITDKEEINKRFLLSTRSKILILCIIPIEILSLFPSVGFLQCFRLSKIITLNSNIFI